MRYCATGELVMFIVAEERCSAAKVHLRRSEEITALVTKLMSKRSGESVLRGHSGGALEWIHRGGKPGGEESSIDHACKARIEVDLRDDGRSAHRRHVTTGE